MKRENVSQIISHIDEKYINEATVFALDSDHETIKHSSTPAKRTEKPSHRIRWGVMAACLALIVLIGSTVSAFAAEAAEYKNAVAFF